MAITTYAQLLTSVASELHRSDLTSAIPDFVTLAESRINSDLRIAQMETTVASTTAAGVLAIPSTYLELKNAYVSSITPYVALKRKTVDWIYSNYPSRVASGCPKYIAREGSNFIFGPFPDANYTITLNFYNRFRSLAVELNSLFTLYPGLYLYGALMESAPFIKDDKRIAVWAAMYGQLVKSIQRESDNEFLSGSVLEVVAG